MSTCRPVGSALPPRRDVLVAAAEAPSLAPSGFNDTINVARARDRMLEFFEREQVPNEVRNTLAAALNGDLHYQHLLFTAMLDSWPKLQRNINEIARLVSIAPWKVHPHALRGEKPDAASEKIAKEVENLIWTMTPRPARQEQGFEGTIKTLATGYYFGHVASEVRWERGEGGMWKPRATKAVPARFYGYPYDGSEADPEDRLMFDREGGMGARNFEDFPDHKFLIGINAGHPGHPAMAAPLRALSAYWLAAVYGLKWFVNFTQLFGIPWRHAEVADPKDENAVARALATIGSTGYVITRPGTKINVMQTGQTGQSLPQRELLDLADKQCDVFILGQTLTSGVDNSGSRALGEVHQETKNGMVDTVADFVGEILTYQLCPSMVAVNGGDQNAVPQIWAKREEARDEEAKARRMESLTRIGIPMGKAYVYEDLGVPIPAPSEELFQATPNGAQGEPATGAIPHETKEDLEKPEPREGKRKVKAADAGLTWRRFPAGSGSLGIPRSEMPQIASGNRGAMVSFLRARGIESKSEEVQADTLKPTQAEYSPEKVMKAHAFKGGNRSILVSEDDFVVDGHHQWRAAVDKVESIKIIRLMAPIHRVLMMAHRMPSTTVAAAEAEDGRSTIDRLSNSVLESLTGVTREWLSPVRPAFERLAALAMSQHVSDDDFLQALEKAQRELPELFDRFDTAALQNAFEETIASGMLAGSVSRYEA